MGIHINLAVVMHDWSRRHGLVGPSLTLGVKDTSFTRAEYDRALAPPDAAPRANEAASHAAVRAVTAGELFTDDVLRLVVVAPGRSGKNLEKSLRLP